MTATVRLLVGDVFDRLAELPDRSVHCVVTSPPYWRKRRYLPVDHPDAGKEIGQEPSPGEFLGTLLRVTDELWRVLRDDGTVFVNLGDSAAGSGGAGGDYNEGGWRDGQPKYVGSARRAGGPYDATRTRGLPKYGDSLTDGGGLAANGKRRSDTRPTGIGTPRPKSVCWLPELFGASLAYGRNLLTGEPCRQWITRPPVTWCKPGPTPGAITDKFREATELVVFAVKQPHYFFDLDTVRLPMRPENERGTRNQQGPKQRRAAASESHPIRYTRRTTNPNGAPPVNWWVIPTEGYLGAHYATFPPELIFRPILAGCPVGGWVLDPFGGSGTTAMVATANNRNCVLIDLDGRNVDLIHNRVGMLAEVGDGDQLDLFEESAP